MDNVLFYVKGGGAVTSNRYFGSVAPGVAAFDTATEQPLGRHGRRRLRIRLRAELDGRRSNTTTCSWAPQREPLFDRRVSRPAGMLSRTDNIGQNVDHRHRPRELPLGWPDRREVLIEA